MTDPIRCWLVERGYDDKGLLTLAYATPDGERVYRRELAAATAGRMGVTAAMDAEPDRLTSVEDESLRERYATEADRMAARHDPDETV